MKNRPTLYKNIHKGIRAMLLDLTVEAGRVDWNDAAAVAKFRDVARDVFGLLETHAALENAFIAPLLERFAPRVAPIIGSAHDEQDELLPALMAQLDAFDARSADAPERGHTIAVRLSRLVAESFTHMADEEELAMPALRAALDDAALHDVERRLQAAVPPEKMAQVAPHLIPALNRAERLEMLGAIKAAGAEPFASAMRLASQLLSPTDYAVLQRALDAEQAA